jgi:hypothetical protein
MKLNYWNLITHVGAFLLGCLISLIVSTLLYSGFYYFWIPKIAHEMPVYFQFELADRIRAHATVDFTFKSFSRVSHFFSNFNILSNFDLL